MLNIGVFVKILKDYVKVKFVQKRVLKRVHGRTNRGERTEIKSPSEGVSRVIVEMSFGLSPFLSSVIKRVSKWDTIFDSKRCSFFFFNLFNTCIHT